MKHMHSLGIAFSGFKSATALCGRRVKTVDLALTADTDCPQCRAKVENNHAIALLMIAHAEAQYGPTETTQALRVSLAQGPCYRNPLL